MEIATKTTYQLYQELGDRTHLIGGEIADRQEAGRKFFAHKRLFPKEKIGILEHVETTKVSLKAR